MKRQKIVAGNWKMNNTLTEGTELAAAVAEKWTGDHATLILAPPFIHLKSVGDIIKDAPHLKLAAQNCNQNDKGAFTGEVSADMLLSVGVEYVILGHSERREYFGETDNMLAEKVTQVLTKGLIPIFCCGENLEIRESGKHFDWVTSQIANGLFHLSEEDFQKVVIAYEPIWAIGTGVTASKEQAQDMHHHIREVLVGKYGVDIADATTILYGGSCKPSNAEELFAQADVDGGLIGGAALKADDFVTIVNSY